MPRKAKVGVLTAAVHPPPKICTRNQLEGSCNVTNENLYAGLLKLSDKLRSMRLGIAVTVYDTLRRLPAILLCRNQLMVNLGEDRAPCMNYVSLLKKDTGLDNTHTRSKLLCCVERPGVDIGVARWSRNLTG